MIKRVYKQSYSSPLGELSLLADDRALIGCWFLGQRYFEAGVTSYIVETNEPLKQAKVWLDNYFVGNFSQPKPNLAPVGTTFQKHVWQALTQIPPGQVRTYGDLAKQLSCPSAQAIGGAVGRNPLSLFIACHRVIGAGGKLTGYAAGLDKKIWLLKHEGVLDKQARQTHEENLPLKKV